MTRTLWPVIQSVIPNTVFFPRLKMTSQGLGGDNLQFGVICKEWLYLLRDKHQDEATYIEDLAFRKHGLLNSNPEPCVRNAQWLRYILSAPILFFPHFLQSTLQSFSSLWQRCLLISNHVNNYCHFQATGSEQTCATTAPSSSLDGGGMANKAKISDAMHTQCCSEQLDDMISQSPVSTPALCHAQPQRMSCWSALFIIIVC